MNLRVKYFCLPECRPKPLSLVDNNSILQYKVLQNTCIVHTKALIDFPVPPLCHVFFTGYQVRFLKVRTLLCTLPYLISFFARRSQMKLKKIKPNR